MSCVFPILEKATIVGFHDDLREVFIEKHWDDVEVYATVKSWRKEPGEPVE